MVGFAHFEGFFLEKESTELKLVIESTLCDEKWVSALAIDQTRPKK